MSPRSVIGILVGVIVALIILIGLMALPGGNSQETPDVKATVTVTSTVPAPAGITP